MKKFRLLTIVALFLCVVVVSTLSQTNAGPYVAANMIEISYNGTTFMDASAFVSEIQVLTGHVTAPLITRARRGDIITYEAELGSPHEDKKATWKINTGLMPRTENRIYIRFSFGIRYYDGTSDESPPSPSSDKIQLTGPPKKPVGIAAETPL